MTFASNGTSITYNGRVVGEIASSCDRVPMGVCLLPKFTKANDIKNSDFSVILTTQINFAKRMNESLINLNRGTCKRHWHSYT